MKSTSSSSVQAYRATAQGLKGTHQDRDCPRLQSPTGNADLSPGRGQNWAWAVPRHSPTGHKGPPMTQPTSSPFPVPFLKSSVSLFGHRLYWDTQAKPTQSAGEQRIGRGPCKFQVRPGLKERGKVRIKVKFLAGGREDVLLGGQYCFPPVPTSLRPAAYT